MFKTRQGAYQVKLHVLSISTFLLLSFAPPFLMAGAPLQVAPAVKVPIYNFLSFREWKNSMIWAAESRLKGTQNALNLNHRLSASADPNLKGSGGAESGLSVNLQELQKQAEKDQYQLLITKELTISDYFVGYLTKQKNITDAIKEVSGRLSAEEIAELMSAYANNFFTSKPTSPSAPSRAGFNQ